MRSRIQHSSEMSLEPISKIPAKNEFGRVCQMRIVSHLPARENQRGQAGRDTEGTRRYTEKFSRWHSVILRGTLCNYTSILEVKSSPLFLRQLLVITIAFCESLSCSLRLGVRCVQSDLILKEPPNRLRRLLLFEPSVPKTHGIQENESKQPETIHQAE